MAYSKTYNSSDDVGSVGEEDVSNASVGGKEEGEGEGGEKERKEGGKGMFERRGGKKEEMKEKLTQTTNQAKTTQKKQGHEKKDPPTQPQQNQES